MMKLQTILLTSVVVGHWKYCKSDGIPVPIEKLGHNYAVNFTVNGEIFFNVVCSEKFIL